MRGFIVPAVMFLCLATTAQAQVTPPAPDLSTFLMRADQQQAAGEMMTAQWRRIFENCPTPSLVTTSKVMTATAPTFDSSGAPVSGRWRVVGRVEGCGESRTLGIEYLFGPDGQMRKIGTLPGTTIADLSLQRDSLMYASMGMVRLTPSGCKDVLYTDTKFIGFVDAAPVPGTNRRPWTEEWTVRACGVTGIVTMHFTPDATGTGIRSSPNETRQISP